MNLTEDNIKEICDSKAFTSFWELFDFLILAAYEETEALLIASEYFNGDIWGNVINAAKSNHRNDNTFTFSSGYTYTSAFAVSGTSTLNYHVMGTDVAQDDDMFVELFLMTDKANPKHKLIYKAYVETRKYEPNDVLEPHVKTLKLLLTSELAIRIFNEGYSNLK